MFHRNTASCWDVVGLPEKKRNFELYCSWLLQFARTMESRTLGRKTSKPQLQHFNLHPRHPQKALAPKVGWQLIHQNEDSSLHFVLNSYHNNSEHKCTKFKITDLKSSLQKWLRQLRLLVMGGLISHSGGEEMKKNFSTVFCPQNSIRWWRHFWHFWVQIHDIH